MFVCLTGLPFRTLYFCFCPFLGHVWGAEGGDHVVSVSTKFLICSLFSNKKIDNFCFFSSRHFRAWSLTQVPPFFPPPSFAGQQPANWQSSKGKEGRWRRSRRRRQAQSLTQKHWEEGAGLVVFSPPHTYFMKTDPPSSSIKDLP